MWVHTFAASDDLLSQLHNLRAHFGCAQVCERHFKTQYLRTSTYTDVDGRTIKAPMKFARLTADALPTIFPDFPAKIFDFRVLIGLLDSVETYSSKRPIQKQDKVQEILNLVVFLLDDITNEDLEESERAVVSKGAVSPPNEKGQRCEVLFRPWFFSSILHTISPHAYKFSRHSGKLVLPHPETVKRVCAACDVSPSKEQSEEGFLRFIKHRASILKQHERNVSLMLDKIHLQQFFEFKGACLTGSAAHCAEPVKTARFHGSVTFVDIQGCCAHSSCDLNISK